MRFVLRMEWFCKVRAIFNEAQARRRSHRIGSYSRHNRLAVC
jgi:hypothetical protein